MGVPIYAPDSLKIVHVTKVDFSRRHTQEPLYLVQYDREIPVIQVHLYLNGNVYSIPAGETVDVKVRWGKDDSHFVHKDILGSNEARTIVYIGVDLEMTKNPGVYNPILELVVPINDTINKSGSSPFKVVVEQNPIENTEE